MSVEEYYIRALDIPQNDNNIYNKNTLVFPA